MNKKKPVQPTLEDLLLALRRKIVECMRADTLVGGLTVAQSEALRIIGSSETVTMKEIASSLKITPPSVTSMIEDMEKKGLVERIPDTNDRRVVCAQLTTKAKRSYREITARKKAIIDRMLLKLTPSDKRSLERIISIIISK